MTETIHTAINKIMDQVGYVKKQRSPNLNYTYAGEAALIAALRPEMVENGVFCHVAEVRNVTVREYATKNGTQMVNVTLIAVIRFFHAPSATSIDVVACGEGSDSGDKATNKAMTAAYKYALRQTFCIETGDDPDHFQPAPKAAPENQPDKAAPLPANGKSHDTSPVQKKSRETAEAMTHKSGRRYGDLDNVTLAGLSAGLEKSLQKEGLTIAEKEALQQKVDAIAVILNCREKETSDIPF